MQGDAVICRDPARRGQEAGDTSYLSPATLHIWLLSYRQSVPIGETARVRGSCHGRLDFVWWCMDGDARDEQES